MAYTLKPMRTSNGTINVPTETFDFTLFAETEQSPSRYQVTDTTAAIDRPFVITEQIQDLPNIYKGTSVDPSVYAPSKTGVRLYTGIDGIFSYSDATDAANPRMDFPVHAHIVLEVPKSAYLDMTSIESVISNLVGIYNVKGDTSPLGRLGALLRGALPPKGV